MLLPGEKSTPIQTKTITNLPRCPKKDSDISTRHIEYFVVFCVFMEMPSWQAAGALMNLRCFVVQQLLLKTT